jgi:septal ring factor EnvC (AmiA/AmiB activator)
MSKRDGERELADLREALAAARERADRAERDAQRRRETGWDATSGRYRRPSRADRDAEAWGRS